MTRWLAVILMMAFGAAIETAHAAEVKLLTVGAMKGAIQATAADFQKANEVTLSIENETAGVLTKRIQDGAAFDVAVLPPAALTELAKAGKVTEASPLARVGIGVMVKAGAPKPDIGTLDAFKQALLNAKSIAYIDPASGGSSGIYLARLFERLGIADALKPKTKLKQGGLVADLIVSGEAELGLQQMSEVVTASGVTLVGPLPAEVQNYTIYAGAVGTKAQAPAAGAALIAWLKRPAMAPILQARGILPPS